MAEAALDVDAWLAQARAGGLHRHDPVRFALIDAMARRAAGHEGAAWQRLQARLVELIAGWPPQREVGAAPTGAPAQRPGPLGRLVASLPAAGLPGEAAAAPGELKTMHYFRSTWTRLSAERRLTQSLAEVPENAGPLNSQQLVHRSLRLMRELSPAYLERFVQYVDALLWLDQLDAAAPAPRKPRGG